MNTKTLRKAASTIREDYSGTETDTGENDPFMFAVADWLEATAYMRGAAIVRVRYEPDRALAVARAYLGEDA